MYDEQYEAVRRQVVRRFIFRASFFFHLILYVLTMLLIFTTAAKTPDDLFGGIFTGIVWGMGLFAHGALAFNWFSRWFGNWFDQATQRELERIRQLEKPKRKHLEVGEDGELIEVGDNGWDENEEQAKHHA
ncbi:MAG TPA: hypothetical protein VHO69_15755 [Phototrophicaceae bacterium]|nr:hypothetical protein [Phototrophicaceae bacterium]